MSTPEFATLTTDDLVTGEAVALDLPPAGLGIRIASGLIDLVITLILFVIAVFVLLTAALQTDAALMWAAFIGTLIVVFLVFPATLETWPAASRSASSRAACARSATTPGRSPSSTRSCGP